MAKNLQDLEISINSLGIQIRRSQQEIQNSNKHQIRYSIYRLRELQVRRNILMHQKREFETGTPITQELTSAQLLAITQDILETLEEEVQQDNLDFWDNLDGKLELLLPKLLMKTLKEGNKEEEPDQSPASLQKR